MAEELRPGVVLNGRYAIDREIGRGGFGVVYLAIDQQLHGKPVVVKVLACASEASGEEAWSRKKFRQEVEALARLNHPGILSAFDTGDTPGGAPYIVVQYVKGANLRSVMKPRGMDFARVARIVRQIGHALEAAHEHGIFHRDLKPENVMLEVVGEGDELVKLIDFGIATVPDSTVSTGGDLTTPAGSPDYMAPEQLMGKPVRASDIYAFGTMAYEMVTGQLPFHTRAAVLRYQMQREGVRVKPAALRPDLPPAADAAILKALAFEAKDRHARAEDFAGELVRAITEPRESPVTPRPANAAASGQSRPTEATTAATTTRLRVALLYKRNAQPDEQVLKLLETELGAHGYHVFIDRHLSIGVEWAREIERQVRTADAVIPLVSAASVTSEMMCWEVQTAHETAERQAGRPRLLPVRVGFDGPLPEPLAGILDRIQYAVWKGPRDSDRLVAELLEGLAAGPASLQASLRRRLEPVGGAVPLDSEFYIERAADEDFGMAIARHDSIVLVKGARQIGKTSLLARGLGQARSAGAKVVLTDLQKLNAAHLESIDAFLLTLGESIADQLDLAVGPEQGWTPRRGASMNFERYLRREVLARVPSRLVWGLDEVDRLFGCNFGTEVFGLFRSWHNERSLDPDGPWKGLTLAIAYATEAHLFITDLNQSPFNVGTRLTLDDFSLEQVAELNRRYGAPLREPPEVAGYFELVGGHPYLVRRGLHEMATRNTPLATLEAVADRDEGPFGDHLRRILVLLAQDPALCDVVRGILRGKPCPTPESFYRLRSAGVMAGDSAGDVQPRCRLYASYLRRHLL
jgi:hypothetical protein